MVDTRGIVPEDESPPFLVTLIQRLEDRKSVRQRHDVKYYGWVCLLYIHPLSA